MQIELFDVKAYFEDRGIRAYTAGKNCSPGWINIRCIYCNDKTNHLGVNLTSKKWHCWKCHKTGLVTRLLTDLGESHILDTMNQFVLTGPHVDRGVKKDVKGLPKEARDILPRIHKQYLVDRGFDPNFIQGNYGVKACWEAGKYKFRLIIPIIMNGRLAGFTARDVSGENPIRYKQQPTAECRVHPRNWVYNIDSVGHTAVIVEGPFDVWRMGGQFISFMGTEITTEQILALLEKGVTRAVVIYDPEEEAQQLADYYAFNLAMFIPQVETILINIDGDPADLSPQQAAWIRKEIL